jgi:putative PIN family toxin of toxin-antitoxin system
MSARKHRIRVVLDTNVFVRNFRSRKKSSPNRRIIRLWLMERRLQLIVSDEIVAEYLEIFEHILGMSTGTIKEWEKRFTEDSRTTFVSLARRDIVSRDPDDNVFCSTARAGNAPFLITNDRDLLDIPVSTRSKLPFLIATPARFLSEIDAP